MAKDWAALSARGGAALEDLIAVCLVRRHRDATQTNPSQGDGGVDVSRSDDEGLEVWQAKNFTSPLTASQWTQVERSWTRFWTNHVKTGERIARYHLVTPWTPTREAVARFEKLTEAASFPRQWDGEAFLEGLVDEFPESYERWLHGPAAMEQFTLAKAVVAASPIEQGSTPSMLEAVNTRDIALDALVDKLSDDFYYDRGTFTSNTGDVFPLPPSSGAVAHRVQALGNNRFRYTSAVPRHDGPPTAEARISIQFKVEPETGDAQAVQDWFEWGVPFENLPATVEQVGGPFPGTTEGFFTPRVKPSPRPYPDIVLTAVDDSNDTVGRLRFTVREATTGMTTGWIRLVGYTPSGLVRFEQRLVPHEPENTHNAVSFSVGNLDGADPAAVLAEIEALMSIKPDHRVDVAVEDVTPLFVAKNYQLPAVLPQIEIIARSLIALQPHANDKLLMPDIDGVLVGEVSALQNLVAVYEGGADGTTWDEAYVTVSALSDLDVLQSGMMLQIQTEPEFTLGSRTYHIDHTVVDSRASVQLDPTVNPKSVAGGKEIRLVPADDATRVVAPLADWERHPTDT